MYTKEKSGILRAERLRDALYDVGFQLGSDVMAIIMLRYMRKDGTVRMGDFASAILHLTTAFEVFQKKDHDQDNVVKIEMVDVSVLMCMLYMHVLMFMLFTLPFYSRQWIKSVLRC